MATRRQPPPDSLPPAPQFVPVIGPGAPPALLHALAGLALCAEHGGTVRLSQDHAIALLRAVAPAALSEAKRGPSATPPERPRGKVRQQKQRPEAKAPRESRQGGRRQFLNKHL